jgi:hypothetical protein
MVLLSLDHLAIWLQGSLRNCVSLSVPVTQFRLSLIIVNQLSLCNQTIRCLTNSGYPTKSLLGTVPCRSDPFRDRSGRHAASSFRSFPWRRARALAPLPIPATKRWQSRSAISVRASAASNAAARRWHSCSASSLRASSSVRPARSKLRSVRFQISGVYLKIIPVRVGGGVAAGGAAG